MSKVVSIIDLELNGTKLDVHQGAKLKIGGIVREDKTSARKVHYSEKIAPSEVEADIAATADVDVRGLQNTVDATLKVSCDNGLTYVVSNAFTTDALEVNGEGKIALKMKGDPAQQL